MPYYMTNQLFAGSSYYNVYFNGDGLFGIYSLPDEDSEEMDTMMDSSFNGEDIPVDLVIHTFNMLAFNMDNLYGLKDIMEVESYYTLLQEERNEILVRDPEEFDEGLEYIAL